MEIFCSVACEMQHKSARKGFIATLGYGENRVTGVDQPAARSLGQLCLDMCSALSAQARYSTG